MSVLNILTKERSDLPGRIYASMAIQVNLSHANVRRSDQRAQRFLGRIIDRAPRGSSSALGPAMERFSSTERILAAFIRRMRKRRE